MTLDLPFWIKQRQAKLEELSTGRYKVSGPNLSEAVITVRIGDNLRWQGVLQTGNDGSDIDATSFSFASAKDALTATFELYRTHMIV